MSLFDDKDKKKKELLKSVAEKGDIQPIINPDKEVNVATVGAISPGTETIIEPAKVDIGSDAVEEIQYAYENCHQIIADNSVEVIPKQPCNLKVLPMLPTLGSGKVRMLILDPKLCIMEWLTCISPILNDFYSNTIKLFNTGSVPVRINKGAVVGWYYDIPVTKKANG